MSEQIETAEELDALPDEVVILDNHKIALQRRYDGWWTTTGMHGIETSVVAFEGLPATVLYRPDAKPETAAEVVERAAEVMWGAAEHLIKERFRDHARALAAAGLLRGTVAAEQREAMREKVAAALADDWNPDRDPVLTAMFRDYAETATATILAALGLEVVDGE